MFVRVKEKSGRGRWSNTSTCQSERLTDLRDTSTRALPRPVNEDLVTLLNHLPGENGTAEGRKDGSGSGIRWR